MTVKDKREVVGIKLVEDNIENFLCQMQRDFYSINKVRASKRHELNPNQIKSLEQLSSQRLEVYKATFISYLRLDHNHTVYDKFPDSSEVVRYFRTIEQYVQEIKNRELVAVNSKQF